MTHGVGDMMDAIGCVIDVFVSDAYGTMTQLPSDAITDDVTIRHGRTSVETTMPEAGTASFTVIDRDGAYLDQYLLLRRKVTIQLSAAAMTYWSVSPADPPQIIFTGRIAEVTVSPGDNGMLFAEIVATSMLAELGRAIIGDVPWPSEVSTARALRIVTLANLRWNGAFEISNLYLTPRDVDRRSALDLLDEQCRDTGDTIVEHMHSDEITIVAYTRRDPAQAWNIWLTLDACNLLNDWHASYHMGGFLNRWSVGYGVPASGADQSRKLYTDSDSVSTFGVIDTSLGTQLNGSADADEMMRIRLPLFSTPKPELPDLVFDLWRTCPITVGQGFFGLGPGNHGGRTAHQVIYALWYVSNLPEGLPVNRKGFLWLEGLTQHISRDGWRVTASVTDPWPNGNAQIWDGIPSTETWDSVPSTVSWDNVNLWNP